MKGTIRKIAAVLLVCCLLCSTAAAFSDVDRNQWYAAPVQTSQTLGIMEGVSARCFEPDASLTRAMCAAILCRMAQGTPKSAPSFSDVAAGKWYAGFVFWAKKSGVVTGFSDGTFRPDQAVTRQELAGMLYRFMQSFGWRVKTEAVRPFRDESETDLWARPAVLLLHQAGILQGEGGYLRPKAPVTRAQAAAILTRLTEAWYIPILGESEATAEQMRTYLLEKNPNAPQSVLDMIPYYLSEGKAEGVRGDLAFAQSCLETGNFTFAGSAVTLSQNNFCGMGVVKNGVTGNSFPDARTGIRAQIQHLKAYAGKEPLQGACVDPRFSLVTRGSAPYLQWLGAQENPKNLGWATGEAYGPKIRTILLNILQTEEK